MATQFVDTTPAGPLPQGEPDKRYLMGPIGDFLCFGGSTLIILPLLALLPADRFEPGLAALMLLVAHVVNNPHFAHSYQIFYRGYREKAFTPSLGRTMQARYLFAGIAVPILLFAFLIGSIAAKNVVLLGYAANAMTFFVGWHYVKQGYGLLMVDAALKRRFFSAPEKNALLINAYVVWIATWLMLNGELSKSELWGIQYFTFELPAPFAMIGYSAAAVTSAYVGWTLLRRARAGQEFPTNGLIAYFVSLYPWMLFIRANPLWLLTVPALHSLQYLAVVWHFETNYQKARLSRSDASGSIVRRLFGSNAAAHVGAFILAGILLGYAGFTFLPMLTTVFVPVDEAIFGKTVFLFVALIVINVHHYFMDNVMWRRENPDAKRYLFS